jgi:hypothetical protein
MPLTLNLDGRIDPSQIATHRCFVLHAIPVCNTTHVMRKTNQSSQPINKASFPNRSSVNFPHPPELPHLEIHANPCGVSRFVLHYVSILALQEADTPVLS